MPTHGKWTAQISTNDIPWLPHYVLIYLIVYTFRGRGTGYPTAC